MLLIRAKHVTWSPEHQGQKDQRLSTTIFSKLNLHNYIKRRKRRYTPFNDPLRGKPQHRKEQWHPRKRFSQCSLESILRNRVKRLNQPPPMCNVEGKHIAHEGEKEIPTLQEAENGNKFAQEVGEARCPVKTLIDNAGWKRTQNPESKRGRQNPPRKGEAGGARR